MGPEWIVVGVFIAIVALVVRLFARRPRRYVTQPPSS